MNHPELPNLTGNASNYQIAGFMSHYERSYPYGVSPNVFYGKVRTAMKQKDMTLSQAVTFVQATIGSHNNPH